MLTTTTLLLAALAIAAPGLADTDAPRYPAQIIIDFVDDVSDEQIAEVRDRLRLLNSGGFHLNSIHSADEAMYLADATGETTYGLIKQLRTYEQIERVEPNYLYRINDNGNGAGTLGNGGTRYLPATPQQHPAATAANAPNDPMWAQQWSMHMVGAADAWSAGATGKGVIVAVIDTGVTAESDHGFQRVEDLTGTDFVAGYDFVNDRPHAHDDHGHGTHVAGTIAQTTNNGVGVAGLAHGASIMPLKVLSAFGGGTAADIADAIRFAADEGANVINMSLGGGPRSTVLEEAVTYARGKGVFVACAAGNAGRATVEYPAAYEGAFAVSSVGPTKQLAFYSSYGKEIRLAAPGGDKNHGGEAGGILQNTIDPGDTNVRNVYEAFQGTSMATPHVAAAAALVFGRGVTDVATVETILQEAAEDAGAAGWDEEYGHGILNAAAAVKATGGARGGWLATLIAIFVFGVFMSLARTRLRLGAFTACILAASGLWFLRSYLGVFAQPLPTWGLAVLPATWHWNVLTASVIPVFALAACSLQWERMRAPLIGAALGWGVCLGYHAVTMPTDVALMFGHTSVLDQVWLFGNVVALGLLAFTIDRVPPLDSTTTALTKV